MNYILAVDIGTTSSKALLVDEDGQVVAMAQQGYLTSYLQPSYAEQDPQHVLDAVRKIIRAVAQQATGKTPRAICFSSAMHSLMAVDAQGKPITPLLIWADGRSAAQAARIRASSDFEFIYTTSGTPVHPMSPLPKLIWMQEHQPEVFGRASRFISIKEFILHQLSGHYVVDYSIASATGLLDIHQLEWSPPILRTAGITQQHLSQLVSPYEKISLQKGEALDLGLNAETVLIAGASDGCLANLGSDAIATGLVSLTVGTSGAVRIATNKAIRDPKHRLFTYRLDEQRFITGGASNNGLVLLDWFQRSIGQGEWSFDTFVQQALLSPPGARGLLFLPYVFGERAPYYDSDLRGAYVGLGNHHTLSDQRRALMEGICFELKSIVNSLTELHGPQRRILASGGFTKSTEWLQLLADILNLEVVLRDTHDASSLGAALMGFKAMGVDVNFQNPDENRCFVPRAEYRALYDELFEIFVLTTSRLTESAHRLAAIANQRGS